MFLAKRINFTKTLITWPLVIFFLSQLTSTFISIDFRTSVLGYYSRFHGGLLSTISYTLLYWAYVSNMDKGRSKKFLYLLLGVGVIVSIWAVFEHIGHSFSCLIFPGFESFDVTCWDQDVKNRVFATLGQPNWLAAWIVGITPLTWAYGISNFQFPISKQISSYKLLNKLFWILLSALFFVTLLFTKSRSGLLGFIAADIMFWAGLIWVTLINGRGLRDTLKKFRIYHSAFIILVLISGTPWTSNLKTLLNKNGEVVEERSTSGTALEVGGTDSANIRKIVWKGTLDIWKNYPLFGSGVETFAYSYLKFRPVEHNLTSEWNYLYNKAHNEYLNMAATTGSFGLASYLILIGAISFLFFKQLKIPVAHVGRDSFEFSVLNLALLSGFASILVTNFFGFSVVPVALLFFLFPAIAISLNSEEIKKKEFDSSTLTTAHRVGVLFTLILAFYFLILISKYWYSDFVYAKGRRLSDSKDYIEAREVLLKATKLSPNESVYWEELSRATSTLAVLYLEKDEGEIAQKLAERAITESERAVSLSPSNVNYKKARANIFINLSSQDPDYLYTSRDILSEALKLAPTDAHLTYNLALSYFRTGEMDLFLQTIKRAIELKPNYKDARLTLANFYVYEKMPALARHELEYILDNIGADEAVQRKLDNLETQK
jgi:O-antigen ligase